MPKRAKNSRPCARCGRVWLPYEDQTRFCSKSCEWHAVKGPEFNAKIARESAGRRGDAQRDRGEGRSYRKMNGRHEHRAVMEKVLGRPLGFDDVVHHIDGDKRNNAPSNLRLMTRAEHMREHGIGIPGAPLPWKPWEQRGKR